MSRIAVIALLLLSPLAAQKTDALNQDEKDAMVFGARWGWMCGQVAAHLDSDDTDEQSLQDYRELHCGKLKTLLKHPEDPMVIKI